MDNNTEKKNVVITYFSDSAVNNILFYRLDGDPKEGNKKGKTVEKGGATAGNIGALNGYLTEIGEKINVVHYFASETVRGITPPSEGVKNGDRKEKQLSSEGVQNKVQKKETPEELIKKQFDHEGIDWRSYEIKDAPDPSENLSNIIKLANELEKDPDNTEYYIDINGGFRQANFTMLAISYILKEKGKNIKGFLTNDFNLGKSKAGEYTEKNPIKVFCNTDCIYPIDYSMAVESFMTNGTVEKLKEVLEFSDDEEKNDNNDVEELSGEAEKIIREMQEFIDATSMCVVSSMIETWKDLRTDINDYKYETKSVKEQCFHFIIDLIANKYYADNTDNIDNTNMFIPQLIKWCVDHDYIQQAVTIFNEKIPELFKSRNKKNLDKNSLLSFPSQNAETETYYSAYYKKRKCTKKTKTMRFFEYYVLIDCIRDHANHASNKGVDDLLKDHECGLFLEEFKKDHEEELHGFPDNGPKGYITSIMKDKKLIKAILYKAIDLYNGLNEDDKNLYKE